VPVRVLGVLLRLVLLVLLDRSSTHTPYEPSNMDRYL
jgi:hypothetical protein